METPEDFKLSCPIRITNNPAVLMAHGGGGRLMRQLIGKMFAAACCLVRWAGAGGVERWRRGFGTAAGSAL
jgi:hypothetical protein